MHVSSGLVEVRPLAGTERADVAPGQTVRVNRMAPANQNIYVKCEYLNPAGSHKDRAYARMVVDLWETGRLGPGVTLCDYTTGNGGIALALERDPFFFRDVRADILETGPHAARAPLVDDAGGSAFSGDHEVRIAVPLFLDEMTELLTTGNAGAEVVDAHKVHAGIGNVIGDDRDIGGTEHLADGRVGRRLAIELDDRIDAFLHEDLCILERDRRVVVIAELDIVPALFLGEGTGNVALRLHPFAAGIATHRHTELELVLS